MDLFPARIERVVRRTVREALRRRRFAREGISYLPPDYLFAPRRFPRPPVVIDVGCGSQAELSVAMIERYGATALAVDPTAKHRPALAALEAKHGRRFRHISLAVSHADGLAIFSESQTNESGSILADHVNAMNDEVVRYEVRTVTLPSLLEHLSLPSCSLLKLDLEGAEYALLHASEADELLVFEQIFVEFHHHAVDRYGIDDTVQAVARLADLGYQSYSLNGRNYLFLRRPDDAP